VSDLRRLYQRLHDGDPAQAEAACREVAKEATDRGARVVVISACLLGERTRYDGRDKAMPEATAPLVDDEQVRVLPLCPEILGGMGCPRPPVHFQVGDGDDPAARVTDDAGRDRTEALFRGARRAALLADLAGAGEALLKENSPSCGVHAVYGPRGTKPGRGALTAALSHLRLPVWSECDVVKKG
jgi:uncharacterized protein YbbK (DUF523 family)